MTLAVVPLLRRLRSRRTASISKWSGPAICIVCSGPALDSTSGAVRLWPLSRVTPVTRSASSTSTCATPCPQRMSAPASRAARAKASLTAAMPSSGSMGSALPPLFPPPFPGPFPGPAAVRAEPGGLGLPSRYISENTVPGERGPAKAPRTASAAMAPASGPSPSSSTSRSWTLDRVTRRNSCISFLPISLRSSPSRASTLSSERVPALPSPPSSFGGVWLASRASRPANRISLACRAAKTSACGWAVPSDSRACPFSITVCMPSGDRDTVGSLAVRSGIRPPSPSSRATVALRL